MKASVKVSEIDPSYFLSTSSNSSPVYYVLEKVKDRITGTTWNKLITNSKATRLILNSKSYSS